MAYKTKNKWKKMSVNPFYWKKGDNYVQIGQNTTGNYDVWIQKQDKITKILAGVHNKPSVSKIKAIKMAKEYINKH